MPSSLHLPATIQWNCVGVRIALVPRSVANTAYPPHTHASFTHCSPDVRHYRRRQAWVNTLEQTGDDAIGATVLLSAKATFVPTHAASTIKSFVRNNSLGIKKASDVDKFTLNELINASIPTDDARAIKAARYVTAPLASLPTLVFVWTIFMSIFAAQDVMDGYLHCWCNTRVYLQSQFDPPIICNHLIAPHTHTQRPNPCSYPCPYPCPQSST
jgi:hypothetical protein